MKDKERTYYVCTKLNEDRETGPRLFIIAVIQLYHSIAFSDHVIQCFAFQNSLCPGSAWRL